MKCSNRLLTPVLVASIAISLTFGVGGCSVYRKNENLIREIKLLRQENHKLSAKLEEGNALAAKLQIELMKKQENISQLKSTQQNLTEEVVQKRIRPPTAGTKVEAATFLAETATKISAAEEDGNSTDGEIFAQADSLMNEANEQLEKGNYEQASTLASQALEQVEALRLRDSAGKERHIQPYADFISPLQLKVVKRSNVRKHPGIQSALLTTLELGTVLTATGHQENWIKVILTDGRTGWIHSSLISVTKSLNKNIP